jgi:hypothetical protein
MTIWRMGIVWRMPKATNTISEYVILITFPLKQCVTGTPFSVALYVYYSSRILVTLVKWNVQFLYDLQPIIFPLSGM